MKRRMARRTQRRQSPSRTRKRNPSPQAQNRGGVGAQHEQRARTMVLEEPGRTPGAVEREPQAFDEHETTDED